MLKSTFTINFRPAKIDKWICNVLTSESSCPLYLYKLDQYSSSSLAPIRSTDFLEIYHTASCIGRNLILHAVTMGTVYLLCTFNTLNSVIKSNETGSQITKDTLFHTHLSDTWQTGFSSFMQIVRLNSTTVQCFISISSSIKELRVQEICTDGQTGWYPSTPPPSKKQLCLQRNNKKTS